MALSLAALGHLSIAPPPAIAEERPASPAAVAPNARDQEMLAAMRKIDCATLRLRSGPAGARVISGTVPNDAERAKLAELASRLSPSERPSFEIAVVPPPLCRSIVAFERIGASAPAAEAGIEARLAGGGSNLREGDPIQFEVTAGSVAVNLRVDYFSLDGEVLHMLPNRDQPAVTLAAGARRVFGASGNAGDSWNAGGAPFGNELIAVTATPQGLELGPRPEAELAATYLRELESALLRDRQAGRGAPSVATVLVHTSEREAVASNQQPTPQADGSARTLQSEQTNAAPVPPMVPPMVRSPAAPPSPAAASDRVSATRSAAPVADRSKPGILDQLPRLAAGAVRHGALNLATVVLASLAVAAVLVRRRREMAARTNPDGVKPPRSGLFRRSDRRSASAETHTDSFIRWAGGNRVTLALVFTDIVGSTALGESLKDQRMGALRSAHFARSSNLIREHGGHEIKTIGDSVMVAFRTVNSALDYARALHRDPGGATLPGGAELRIRAGIHIGPMSVENGDVFGRAVNFAARVIGAIAGSEIWVSEQAKADIDALGAGHHEDLRWRRHENIEVKGFTGAVALWSLVTDPEPVAEPAEMRDSAG